MRAINMCMISLIDVQDGVFTSNDIRLITIANSLFGNVDGFGYYLFDTDKLYKTKDEAITFWRENFNEFAKENRNINGIYHVRKASLGTTTWVNGVETSKSGISDDKSHPFRYNDIIVAHNGYLNFRYTHIDSSKYEPKFHGDLIDSQKFSLVLSEICKKGIVTFDNIKDALNLFGGAFCLAIKGKLDNYAWLCRGKDRTLCDMTIYADKTPVGKVVNTSSYTQFLIGELLVDYGLDYTLTDLKENTTYKYTLGTYLLEEAGKILQDSEFTAKTYVNTTYTKQEDSSSVYEEILEYMYKADLIMADLVVLSELLFNKSLFILDINEYKVFRDFMKDISKEFHDKRLNLWLEICKKSRKQAFSIYKENNLHYPYFMNNKSELVKCLVQIKGEKKNNELSLVQ